MMKFRKRVVKILLALALILGMNVTVFAEEYPHNLGEVIDGSTLINSEYSESILEGRARGRYLNRGVARLSDNGNGSVNSYGAVACGVLCDRLELRLTLQRLEGGTWVNVKSYSDTAYNSSLLTKSYNANVTRGYYYRLIAACVAFEGGTSESQMPITDGIWID